jgi:CheY-like chemotaxis protein
MDIQLPGINGLDATRIIKNDPELSEIPVIAVSAHAMHEEMDRAREAGCSGYITKPITPEPL